jgi:hypothetical protein
MKIKTITTFIISICIANPIFCQDTSQNQKLSQEHTYDVSPSSGNFSHSSRSKSSKPHIYRDTRLGSSSSLYNTYKKNDYGAGAVTTNPNKGSGGIASYPDFHADSSKTTNKIHGDTRLGSSSPLYDTYKKNDKGAGAVTTNPHKGRGRNSAPYTPDSTTNGK